MKENDKRGCMSHPKIIAHAACAIICGRFDKINFQLQIIFIVFITFFWGFILQIISRTAEARAAELGMGQGIKLEWPRVINSSVHFFPDLGILSRIPETRIFTACLQTFHAR